MPPEICPSCGVVVPRQARACPECGADEHTGWSEEALGQRLGLPDEEFDYDEFIKEEFGSTNKIRPRGITWFWWVAAIIVLVAVLAWLLHA